MKLQPHFDPTSKHLAREKKAGNCLSTAVLFLVLFSSLSLSTPACMECQDVYPDEWLDLFGIPRNPVSFTIIFASQQAADADFASNTHALQHYRSGRSYSKYVNSELVLLVSLRC